MRLFNVTVVLVYCAGVWTSAAQADNGTMKGIVAVQPSSESLTSNTKVPATISKSASTVVSTSSRTTNISSSDTKAVTNHVSSESTDTTTKEKTSEETQVQLTSVASKSRPSMTTLSETRQKSTISQIVLSSASISIISNEAGSSPGSVPGSQTASTENGTASRPAVTSSLTESRSVPDVQSTPATNASSSRPQSTAAPSQSTDNAKASSPIQQTSSSIRSQQGSSRPTHGIVTGIQEGPRRCLPGSQCAMQLGVGLSFGSIFIIAGLWVIGRRYRRFLTASQVSHREKWYDRRGNEEDDYGSMAYGGDLEMMNMSSAETPPPQIGRTDELFLPGDVQRIVDRPSGMRLEHRRLPAEAYGSVARKPLPAFRAS